MPASYLSPICSSIAVCITTIKFVVPAWRLYYECIRNPKPITGPKSIREPGLWLDTGLSAIFLILSGLLLVFSFVGPKEKGVQILLLLAGFSLIVYHGGYMLCYVTDKLRWLRRAPLICFIVAGTISMIASSVGYTTEVSKIMLLSFFLVEYLIIFIAYLSMFLSTTFKRVVYSLLLWNMGLCCVAWAGALASLVSYLKGEADFITSLWIDNTGAMVWVVWSLWQQWKALPKKGSDEESNISQGSNGELGVLQQDDLRQDSMTQLVAVHVRDSNRKG
ncbi:hypothetical protein B0J14DRAFT_598037 [Halenospora varia]|nr:hypothetical protein B0J14DRAFT_598037 [Halenospora varia]